jgi:hypothetical protein
MSYEETYLDDEDLYEAEDAEEWQEGQCDGCSGSTPEELEQAASGRSIMPVCACAIGQGADSEHCRCGPGEPAEAS